jgi:hypothetical protein
MPRLQKDHVSRVWKTLRNVIDTDHLHIMVGIQGFTVVFMWRKREPFTESDGEASEQGGYGNTL